MQMFIEDPEQRAPKVHFSVSPRAVRARPATWAKASILLPLPFCLNHQEAISSASKAYLQSDHFPTPSPVQLPPPLPGTVVPSSLGSST